METIFDELIHKPYEYVVNNNNQKCPVLVDENSQDKLQQRIIEDSMEQNSNQFERDLGSGNLMNQNLDHSVSLHSFEKGNHSSQHLEQNSAESFSATVQHDLQIAGKFWEGNEDHGEDHPPGSLAGVDAGDDFTVVMTKSQKKRQRKNKKILLQKSDPYNTRYKAGTSKPKLFYD